jgi:ParB family chromosome partitioning protein
MIIKNQIEYRSPEDLRAYPLNDQYHSPLDEGEYAALLASIEELGIQDPLWITPNGTIISGHERWKIAQKKQITKLPIRIVEDSTEQELLYLLISANEAGRGTEKDYIKRAKKVKVLYEHWDIRQGRPSKSRHDVDINESQTNRHNIAEMMGVTDRTYNDY